MISTISTPRLTLRPLTKPTPKNIGWMRDPEVVRYSEQRHATHTLSSQHRYVTSFVGKSHLWGIYRIETGTHIGNVAARHDEPNDVTDVSILIGEAGVWGQGYGKEAWRAACDWLLDKNCGAIRKLEAGCMRSNEAMLKIIRDSKFTQEGERANHFLLGGSPVSMVLFGRSR